MTSPRMMTLPALAFTAIPSSRVAENGTGGPMEETCIFNEEFKFILLPVSYGAVCVVGLLLNSCSLWLFLFRMRPWNATTTYMFNLAVSDTLYVLSLPTLVYYYADRNNWPFGKWLCKIVRFLFYANLYSSILFLACISIHRYIGICHPIRSLRWVKTRHARLVCLGVVGLLLNSCSLWLFLFRMRPWNATTTYMFNLAVSDTLYVLSLPTLVYYYADRNNWPFGKWLCKIVRFLFYANLYSSILFLACISIHRYIGICHPIRSLRWVKTRHARLVCLGVWLVVTLCLIPNLVFVTISVKGNNTLCHDTTKPEEFDHYVHYSSAVMALLFGIPFLVIVVCYCLMAKRLWSPHSLGGSSQTLPSYKRRSIKMIMVVLLVFAISFVPFHITRTIYYASRHLKASCYTLNIVNVTYKITRPLASANSCIDPVLYFLAGDMYRGRLHRALFKMPKSKQALSTSTVGSQFRESSLTAQRSNSFCLRGISSHALNSLGQNR